MAARYYVGHSRNGAEIIRTDTPTIEIHGDRFYALTGPFRTRRGAQVMVDGGSGNPATQTVAQCERIARETLGT